MTGRGRARRAPADDDDGGTLATAAWKGCPAQDPADPGDPAADGPHELGA